MRRLLRWLFLPPDDRDLVSLNRYRRARRCLARDGGVQRRMTPPSRPAVFDWEEHVDQPIKTADQPPHRGS